MKSNGLKKLFAGLSAACLAAAAMPAVSFAAETEVSKVVGDANCDGGVDMGALLLSCRGQGICGVRLRRKLQRRKCR